MFNKGKILIVDDSEMNRSILADMLEEEYVILEAEDGEQAVSIMEERHEELALVLLDIVMPRMDGFGVLETMNRRDWIEDVPVIMISAESGSASVARAYDMGVTDFIARPFDALIVRKRVVNTLLLYAKQKRLASMVEEQITETERRSSLLVEILSHIMEFRNGESGLHVMHVRTLTNFLLKALARRTDKYALSAADIERISVSSALHDIGKIASDEKILNKPGKLTDEEFAIMKTHALRGAEMLNAMEEHRDDPLVRTSYEICRWHHERYDGRGYPDGLVGDEIPIAAQVVALADVYDALTSPRVYKKAIDHDTAVQMILDNQCGVFNPLLMECLKENSESIRGLLKGTLEQSARREAQGIVSESVRPAGASDRTLRLLDQERMKNDSFSAMTNDIQFEYTASPAMISMNPHSAETLGLSEIISDPATDPQLQTVLGPDGWALLSEKIRLASPEVPDITYDCELTYGGHTRWHRVVLKTSWSDEDPPRFLGALGKATDIHETRKKLEELTQKASRDPMTSLLNRAAAQERIEARMLERPQSQYALVLFDLDFFKSANDTYGHQFGDAVIRTVADRLRRSVRGADICCRAGGDEFMIFLEYNTDLEKTVDRIFRQLTGDYEGFYISVTMGVAQSRIMGLSYERLFRAADQALYAAKRDGKGRYCFYDPSNTSTYSAISDIDEDANE